MLLVVDEDSNNGGNRYWHMCNQDTREADTGEPLLCEIRVKGHLDAQWSDWFEGLAVTRRAGGDTLLTGPLADQAALHGLLRRIRDLGLPLVSVNRVGRR